MKIYNFLLAFISLSIFQACIGDDFIDDTIDPVLRISNPVDSLAVGTTFQFEHIYLNNIGREENIDVVWSSENESIVQIDEQGLATTLDTGRTTIKVESNSPNVTLSTAIEIVVSSNAPVDNGLKSSESNIATTSSYVLKGSFSFNETETGVNITFEDDYAASTALPGLYVYLSNNRNSISDAYEISKVEVFNGAHSYDINDVGFNEYQYLIYFCKPFNVKVGDGTL